jgi:hypothetical protein
MRLIPVLAALLLRGDNETRWQVLEPDGALGLIDVLPARAARTKSVYLTFPQQVFI